MAYIAWLAEAFSTSFQKQLKYFQLIFNNDWRNFLQTTVFILHGFDLLLLPFFCVLKFKMANIKNL